MLGIIILNYNTWEETELCVDSIRKNNTAPYRIYLVDNCSTDDSAEKLEALYKDAGDIVLIYNSINSGYSAGNNVGIRRAEEEGCEYIFIVNSDVELLNDAFTIMFKTLESEPDCMMIGPSVMDNNRRESQIPRYVLTPSVFVYERHPFCLIPRFAEKGNRLIPLDRNPKLFEGSVAGCCFGMRTEDFRRLGYFDENVFLYYEEDILGYKMKALGKMAGVNTDARVWHKANVSTNKRGNAFVQFHRWTSVLYLLKEYARISKPKQIAVALWNIITWDALSLKSSDYRSRNAAFRKKNWSIISDK